MFDGLSAFKCLCKGAMIMSLQNSASPLSAALESYYKQIHALTQQNITVMTVTPLLFHKYEK